MGALRRQEHVQPLLRAVLVHVHDPRSQLDEEVRKEVAGLRNAQVQLGHGALQPAALLLQKLHASLRLQRAAAQVHEASQDAPGLLHLAQGKLVIVFDLPAQALPLPLPDRDHVVEGRVLRGRRRLSR